MGAERKRLAALLGIAALAFLFVWLRLGNVSPRGSGQAALQLLHSVLVERDLDFYAESYPLSGGQPPSGGPRTALASFLLAPAFSIVHLVHAFGAEWPPDGLNPNYGLVAGLVTLAVLLIGLCVTARLPLREGSTAGCVAWITAAYMLSSPLLWVALREPGSNEAFGFLLVAALVAMWRVRHPGGWLALATGVALVALEPRAAGWLALAWLVFRRAPEQEAEDRVIGVFLIVFILAPLAYYVSRGGGAGAQPAGDGFAAYPVVLAAAVGLVWLALAGARAGEPCGLADPAWWLAPLAILASIALGMPVEAALVVGSPALLLGCVEAHARLARRGLALTAALGFAALVAGNLALVAARAAGRPEVHDPLAAVVWVGTAPLEHLRTAMAPGAGAMPPLLALEELPAARPWIILAGAIWLALALRVGFSRPGIVALFVAMGFTSAGGMLLLRVAGEGPRHACVYEGGAAFLDGGAAVHRWRPGPGRVASMVDVVTSLEPVVGLSVGDEVAQLTVRDTRGREFAFGIFAGMDTAEESGRAELAPARRQGAERRPLPATGLLKTRLAGYAVSGLRVAKPFVAQSYRKMCHLPWPVEVEEIRLERRHGGARLDVHGLWLAVKRGK